MPILNLVCRGSYSRIAALTALALLLSASLIRAQSTTSTIIKLPGRTIEVVGLSRWTPAMIQDSLNIYAPGDSLFSHSCAATLRYRLGFAEAASYSFRQRDGSIYSFVSVIEPQDSGLVHHRYLPRDTIASEAPWTPLVGWANRELRLLEYVISLRIHGRGIGLPSVLPEGADSTTLRVREIISYLERYTLPDDAATARRVLTESANMYDRVAALAILSGFDHDDATWHALTGALLESDGIVRTVANDVLSAFTREVPRRIDWSPVTAELHALLAGGNLYFLHTILGALVATDVSPELASPLLRDGGHAVLMYAGAEHPTFRGAAHRFLRAVSGQDHGGDLAAWRDWIGGL